MRRSPLLFFVCVVGLVWAGTSVTASAEPPPPSHRTLVKYVGHRAPLPTRAAAASAASVPGVGDVVGTTEIKNREVEARENSPQGGSAVLNGKVRPPSAASVPVTQNAGGVTSRFEGLNHFDSRYSGGGNQFSGEPPDQGMCVSGNRVFEIVNSVVQVYTKAGVPLIAGDKFFPDGPSVGLTLNEFYDLPPTFVRPDGPFGPNMFDTSCLYDSSTNRWFVTSANLDEDPVTGDFTGANQVWLAVSETADPLGGWKIYTIDTTNNGENGTPDHGCPEGACFGDYPQIGLDANGFYLTTNEFEFFGDGFNGAQLYALSKDDLVAGISNPTMQTFQNVHSTTYNDVAYTMQPVNALPADWDGSNGGTMYFGMSGSNVHGRTGQLDRAVRAVEHVLTRHRQPAALAGRDRGGHPEVRDPRLRSAAERPHAAARLRQLHRVHRHALPEHQAADRAGRRQLGQGLRRLAARR